MADLLPDEIAALHAWCPECGGSGMVMRFGPEDCPNLDLHTAIERQRKSVCVASGCDVAIDRSVSNLCDLHSAEIFGMAGQASIHSETDRSE